MSETMPEPAGPAQEAPGQQQVEVPEVPAQERAVAPQEAVEAPQEPQPQPLGVPRTPTGNADVDAALERLADADELPTDGHVEVYEDAHRQIRDALEALDQRPGPPAPTAAPGPYRG